MIIPWWARGAAVLALASAIYGLGRLHQMQAYEEARNEAIVARMEDGDKHVQNYIKKSRQLADTSTVVDRLERMCQPRRVRSPSSSPRADAPDTGDRRAGLEGLARDLRTAKDNINQCEELIEVVKPQLVKPKSWWQFW